MSSAPTMRALVLALALLSPACADAAIRINFAFTGTVSANGRGDVMPNFAISTTSFAGEPMTIAISGLGNENGFYVTHFSVKWSDETYALPYITGWRASALPYSPANDTISSFFSTASLGSTGGTIQIFPTSMFHASTDGDFELNLSYSLGTAHDPLTPFTDDSVTGGGNFIAGVNQGYDPLFGYFAFSGSRGDFVLNSVKVTTGPAPEPSEWMVFLLGFGLAGAAVRWRWRAVPTG